MTDVASSVSDENSGFERSQTGSLRKVFHKFTVNRKSPAVFLDRDGVINKRVLDGYITDSREFHFVEGIVAAIAALRSLELPVIVISRQAGIGKGIMSERALYEITNKYIRELASHDARIDAVYYCPHRPDEGCSCRKPAPGLFLQAAADFRLDLKRSIFIGDTASDLAAADAVGCAFIQLLASPETKIVSAPARTINAQTPAGLAEAVRAHFRSLSEKSDL